MDEDGHAGGQQFRARRRNRQRRAVGQRKRQCVERCLPGEILQLGLRDGRLAEGTPDRRRLLLICQALALEVQEGLL
jgi:hypothetical protein